jgi:hypothetical protein
MTTFKEIRGTDILALSSDPTYPEEGQIWYNSSSGTLKGYQNITLNAWASGGSLSTGRLGLAGSNSGTQSATIIFGGNSGPGAAPTFLASTEKYNGTSWTSAPSLNTARNYLAGCGTQTSALAFSGLTTTPAPSGVSVLSESYNGTSWTNAPTMNTSGQQRFGVGASNTSALCFLGSGPANAFGLVNTESYNGSAWTSVNNANTGRSGGGSAGVQGAALGFGGYRGGSGRLSATESWNGTSWTSVNSLNTARAGQGGSGSNILALSFGGYSTAATGATELWNGTSWTNNPTGLGTARSNMAGIGTQAAALSVGGSPGLTNTEAWNTTALRTRTITVS